MDDIKEHIINAIKDIRSNSKRPDVESIFKYISSKNASNYTVFDIGKVLDDLKSEGKVENKPTKKGMDSLFVASDQLYVEDEKEYETVNFESLKDKEKDIQVDISVETPKLKNLKTPSPPDRAEDFTAQMVAFKTFFMNEISNLKNEIERLKQAANQENNMNMENHSTVNLEYQISLLQRENAFIKTELNNKQNIIEKLLNINSNQSSLNSSKIDVNKNDRVNEKNLKGNPLKYIKDKNSNGNPINNGKPDSYKRNPPKTKVTVTGDSMIKYLKRDNLSSKNNDVKVDAHPGSTTLDMLDYIKPIVRRKPDVLVIHTGTNDLTNGVNTMKEVRQLVKCVKELDKEEEMKIGFSSVINRSDTNLEKEIVDLNLKLKRNQFL